VKLSLGFSTCPNDTFIFDALVNKRIDSKGIEFNLHMADVEELNHMVLAQELDVSKISYGVYPSISDHYIILNAGSAIGRANGPLLISRRKIYPDEVFDLKIAIPGIHTTANLLFSSAFPEAKNKHEYLFSNIEEAVLSDECDAGLIIHESRFTYQSKGLHKIIDIGEYWESHYGYMVPLGGIVAKRSLPLQIIKQLSSSIAESVRFAFANPEASQSFVCYHAQEMKPEVMKQHIDLYVNEYSVDLGPKGRSSIQFMFEQGLSAGLLPAVKQEIFIQ
jgi:1,4-dihydroxy-6-naphthoate synthase